MTLLALTDHFYSDNGHTVKRLFKGKTYVVGVDIGHTTACWLVNKGWMERV